MKYINYQIHILLNSKYKLIINLFIIFIIYISLSSNINYCMNENSNIIETPIIAEAKEEVRPSHQVLALKNEINAFIGPQLDLLEQIEKQTNEIKKLQEELAMYHEIRKFRSMYIQESYYINKILMEGINYLCDKHGYPREYPFLGVETNLSRIQVLNNLAEKK